MSTNDTYTSGLKAQDFGLPASFGRLQTIALALGIVGALATALGAFTNIDQFFRSYLIAYVFWLSIAVGCLAWIMINHLTGGTWGLVMRRTWEAAAGTIKLMIVLALPVLFGMESIFSWARPEAVEDPLIQTKAAYLNVPGFWLRAAVIFAVWAGLAFLLRRGSTQQDATGEASVTRSLRNLSGPGLVMWVVACSFFCWDWLMSLEPHWFSSLYGMYFVSSCGLAGIAFTAVMAWRLNLDSPLSSWFKKKHFHDYGKLTLALTMFWAYMTLSQFIIIWSGNVPEFVPWYLLRNSNGWQYFTPFLIVAHFFLPFALLLSASLKKQPGKLAAVCAYMLFMHYLDLFWQAAPTWYEHLTYHWLDAATLIGIGGLWLWWFVIELKGKALLPVNDPYIPELAPHES